MTPLDLLLPDDSPHEYTVYDRNTESPSYAFDGGQVRVVWFSRTIGVVARPQSDEALNQAVIGMIVSAGGKPIDVSSPEAMMTRVRGYFSQEVSDLEYSTVLVCPGTVPSGYVAALDRAVLESDMLPPGNLYVVTEPEYLGRLVRHGEGRALCLFNAPGVLAFRPRGD